MKEKGYGTVEILNLGIEMSVFKKKFIVIFYCLFHMLSYGSDFEKKFDLAIKNAENNRSFSVSFQQEMYSSLRDKISFSKGKLSVQAPNLFRFEIIEPNQELYVSNGIDFWKYVPRLKHAQHLKVTAPEFTFIKVLTDLSSIRKSYQITEWLYSSAQPSVELVNSDTPPRHLGAGLIAIKLNPKEDKNQKVLYAIVDVRTGFMQELRFVQNNGNRTRFVFTDYVRQQLSDKMFQFTPPAGIVVNEAL